MHWLLRRFLGPLTAPAGYDEAVLRAEIMRLCEAEPEIGAAIDTISDRLAGRLAGLHHSAEITEECRMTIVQAICIGMGGRHRRLADRIADGLNQRLSSAS